MKKAPDAFRTISEVSDWLETPAHVLRFWESKFSQIKPVKRAGGRRYYRPDDMRLIGGIKQLLHNDGLTIKGVQKILREKGVKHVTSLSPEVTDDFTEATAVNIPDGPTDLDTLTHKISQQVKHVAKGDAPRNDLFDEPAQEPLQLVPMTPVDAPAEAEPVMAAAPPETVESVDIHDAFDAPAPQEAPVASDSTASPDVEKISELYSRLKSLRRRMRDPE